MKETEERQEDWQPKVKSEAEQAAEEAEKQAYIDRCDSLWERATDLGLTEEDDELLGIRNLMAEEGNPDEAEAKIVELEASKLEATSKQVKRDFETEQTRNKMAYEIAMTKFIAGEMGIQQYSEIARKAGHQL